LPLDECVKLGMALAKGLATLQRHHLLHRDISLRGLPLAGSDWWGECFYAILLTMRIVCGGPLYVKV
jgi:hypothetical protein